MPQLKATRTTLNLRIHPELQDLIDQAAHVKGQTRTDFLLGAARIAAEDALLDRTVFVVGQAAYDAFIARLDAPVALNEKLQRTMKTVAPWL
jgi:uncharacterized protein (DUF1778 family)